LQTVILYNEHEVKQGGNKEDIRRGYNLWIDITDPSPPEILAIQKNFDIDTKTLETVIHKSKKPQVRVLDNYTFTLILDLKYKSFGTLVTGAVYLFCGRGWLITIHSSEVDLMVNTHILFEQKNKKIMEATIDALHYSIITEIISKYELLLTSIELAITDFEQKSLHKRTSKKMLDSLDTLTKQIIILRRQFWHARDIINFLAHMEKDKEEVKYLQIAYDDISQLIELVESFRDTINSTRDLYMANVSLQMNDTMKTLTIFTVILLPLTLIAGVYGMNGVDVTNPGNISIGFIIVLVSMTAIAAFLFWYFKKKQWIMAKEEQEEEEPEKQRSSKR
jgi:magnesium transporter